MNTILWISTLMLVLMGGIANAAGNHFIDSRGNHLSEFEAHYPLLVRFFGGSVPQRIEVNREARQDSIFDAENDAITLASSLQGIELVSTGIHETAHVAMYRMTKGASLREEFRFLDEGFAYIIQSMVDHRLDLCRKQSMYIANRAMEDLCFTRVQDWTGYFGAWSSGRDDFRSNPNAYPVGASFVFYMMDTFGEAKWGEFLIDIGRTGKLESSLLNIAGKGGAAIEQEWRKYVAGHKDASVSAPRIVEQLPANGAVDIDPGLRELFVRFDQEMNTHRLFIMNDGVDFDWQDARWSDARTLAISLKNGLTPNRQYRVTLGSEEGRLLQNAFGAEFPKTLWSFTTK